MKRAIASALALAVTLSQLAADLFSLPKDLPTAEALIALHKCVKKNEDRALARIAASFGEQSLATKGAGKFNDARTALDSKLSDARSYAVLAGAISTTAASLYELAKEYKNFTASVFRHAQSKPFVAWYYAEANAAISREVKHCYGLYAAVAASGISLMKASMDEKLGLVLTLKSSIDRARRIIDSASLYCYLVTEGGWKSEHIWEILTPQVKGGIANELITNWNKGYEN